MIRARLIGNFAVSITGLNVEVASKAQWRAALGEYGEALQDKIADSFDSQRVAGSSALGANDPAYTRWKLRHGFDGRRGHKSGMLQGVLDGPPLFEVRAITVTKAGKGSARVEFRESKLHSRVPYAEYYEEAKVRRAGILALAKAWVESELKVLRAYEAKQALRARRGAERRRIRNPNVAAKVGLGAIRRLRFK